MRTLFAAFLFTACLSSRAAPPTPDSPPKWTLVVSHNGNEAGKKTYALPLTRQIVPMDGNDWTCATVPDPKGDAFKMGVVCTYQKESVSMPVICHEKMPKVSTLTVGNDKFFSALALFCEPHHGRSK